MIPASTLLPLKQQLLLIVISAFGSSLLALALSRHGIGVSPDSLSYMTVAQNLLMGKGFLWYNEQPFVGWPPLYPFLLAVFVYISNLEVTLAALILNLILFFLIIYSSGKFYLTLEKSSVLSLTVSFMVIFSPPLFFISSFAWSELLFILFINIQFILMNKFITSKSMNTLLYLASVTGLLCIIRYAGITLVITSILTIIYISIIENYKIKKIIPNFIFFSLLPLYIWALRNYILTRSFFGYRPLSQLSLPEATNLLINTVTNWFLYGEENLYEKQLNISSLFVFIIFLTILFFTLLFAVNSKKHILIHISIFILIYSFFIITSSAYIAYDMIDYRLLSPVYIPLTVISVHFTSQLKRNFFYRKNMIWPRITFILLMLFMSFVTIINSLKIIKVTYHDGRGYNSKYWQTSEMIRHILEHKEHLTTYPIYTNDPDALYFLVGIKTESLISYQRLPSPKQNHAHLICFEKGYLPTHYNAVIEDLSKNHTILKLVELSDGAIYFVEPEK